MFDIDVADEIARLVSEHPGKLQLTAPPNRVFYPVERDDALTPYDVERCREELAGRVGLTPEDVWTLTEGSTLVGQAEACVALAREVELEETVIALAEAEPDELAELTVSAEVRNRLAEKGKGYALPGGAFPIADAKHLAVAK